MRRILSLVVVSVLVLGCNPDFPSLDYHGERVSVGSSMVDQVCGGTLTRLDREVEQIETRLDLPIQSSRIDVYILDGDSFEAHCHMKQGGCTPSSSLDQPIVLVEQSSFERVIAHELVHARLATLSAPLFDEGIAEAASPPSCPRPTPDLELSEVLAARKSMDWPDRWDTYYAAEELVAWLLEEFGPGEVLSLMRSIERGSSASTIQAKYLEQFDRDLVVDFLAHRRTQADLDTLPPEDFGCFATRHDPSQGPVPLIADLDCDSERVHNLFGLDGRGYVEWTLNLDHEQTLEVDGVVPVGTALTIEECGCLPKIGDQSRQARPFDSQETLQPSIYRLRWVGPLDEGLSLDVELVPWKKTP